MNKQAQKEINTEILEIIEEINNNIDEFGVSYVERLRYCNARVYRTYGFYILVSYNTRIAAIDNNGICYDFLRYVYGYTATSAQHISKFKSDYGARITRTYYYVE